MPELESERLKLVPLDIDDMSLFIRDRSRAISKLGYEADNDELSNTMKRIYSIKICNMRRDPANYLFYTYWLVILKEKNKVIGEIGFKDVPDDDGRIEVGYGLDEEYRCNGYMTEALKALVSWAFVRYRDKVCAVIASTEKDNVASQKVLQKSGLRLFKDDSRYLWWQIETGSRR